MPTIAAPRTIRPQDPTRYELVAEHADGRRLLICYTRARGNWRKLGAALTTTVNAQGLQRCDVLESATGVAPGAWDRATTAAEGAVCGPWRLHWTGRTERTALTEGELPTIYAAAAPAVSQLGA